MIRPFTFISVLLAAGSGLYLYQAKHRAHVLDREIEDVIRGTEQTRARSGVLQAEWQLLNDTERLGGLADKFLALKATTPGQFVTLADLGARLPPLRPPEAHAPADTDEDTGPALVDDTPVPPIPPEKPPEKPAELVAAAHPVGAKPDRTPAADHRTPAAPMIETRVATSPSVLAVSAMAPMAPRPAAPPPAAIGPAVGSSLGMARTTLPMPMPIGASGSGAAQGFHRFNPTDAPGGG